MNYIYSMSSTNDNDDIEIPHAVTNEVDVESSGVDEVCKVSNLNTNQCDLR